MRCDEKCVFMPLSLPFGACCLFCIYPSKYHMVMHFSSCLSHSLRSAVHPKGAKEVTAGVWTSMDSLYPAMKKRRKSTAITWRQSEGERERGRAVETGRQRGISPLKNYMNTDSKVLSQSWPPTCMLRHGLTWPATHFTLQESGENERRRQREWHVFCFGLYPEREVWT